ncbi:hypothetical protein [Neobacillus sp. 19]|uniref:hypothetical protein n=1 Tax=Neobacillus sp. 19 TaxID=3394458 RepID=UPI003BF75376
MINRLALVTYHFLLELIAGLLILFFFYISKKELPPIFILAAICIVGILLFTVLLTKFHEKGKWLYLVILFPLLILIGQEAGLSLFMAICLGLIVFWRGIYLFEEPLRESESSILLVSFIISMIAIIYAAMSRYPFQGAIIYLVIGQLSLILMGGFFRKWNSMQDDRSKFAVYFLKIFAVVSVIGAALTFLLNYIQFVFFWILQLVVTLFTFIAAPLFGILEYLFSLKGNEERKTNISSGSGLLDEDGKYQEPSYDLTEKSLYILLTLGTISLIIYLFYKKKIKNQTYSNDSASIFSVSERVFGAMNVSKFHQKIKPPNDLIRREIFELEKFAHKLNLGRLSFETLEEWWQRVGLSGSRASIEIYEKVRYGAALVSEEEQILLRTEMGHLKQQLKVIHNRQEEI